MERSYRDRHAGGGHGLVHLILGCGLMLVAIVALGFLDNRWGVIVVLVAAVMCPLTMLGVWHTTEGGRWGWPWRKERRDEQS